MPVIACPIPNCTYATDDVDAIIAVALLNTHAIIHAPTPSTNAAAAKVERVKRPTVTSAGSSEEWDYFLVRWRDCVEATKVTGKDRTIQLLECCDDQLRSHVTHTAQGNPASDPVLLIPKTPTPHGPPPHVPLRRSTRTTVPPSWLNDYVSIIDNE